MPSSAYLDILYNHASKEKLAFALNKRFGDEANTVFSAPVGQWRGNVPNSVIDWAKTIYDMADIDDTTALDHFLSSLPTDQRQQYFYAGNQYDRSLWLNSHFPEIFDQMHNALKFSGLVFQWGKKPSSVFRFSANSVFQGEDEQIDLFRQLLADVLFCPSQSINIQQRQFQFTDAITSEFLECTVLWIKYPTRPKLVAQFEKGVALEETASSYESIFICLNHSLNVLEVSADCTMLRNKIARRVNQALMYSEEPRTWSMFEFDYFTFRSPPHLPIDGGVVREVKVTQLSLYKRSRTIDLSVDLNGIEDVYSCANDFRGLEMYEVSKICLSMNIVLRKRPQSSCQFVWWIIKPCTSTPIVLRSVCSAIRC